MNNPQRNFWPKNGHFLKTRTEKGSFLGHFWAIFDPFWTPNFAQIWHPRSPPRGKFSLNVLFYAVHRGTLADTPRRQNSLFYREHIFANFPILGNFGHNLSRGDNPGKIGDAFFDKINENKLLQRVHRGGNGVARVSPNFANQCFLTCFPCAQFLSRDDNFDKFWQLLTNFWQISENRGSHFPEIPELSENLSRGLATSDNFLLKSMKSDCYTVCAGL